MRFGIFRNASCPLRNIAGIGYASDPSVTLLSPGARIAHSMGLPDVLSFAKIEQLRPGWAQPHLFRVSKKYIFLKRWRKTA